MFARSDLFVALMRAAILATVLAMTTRAVTPNISTTCNFIHPAPRSNPPSDKRVLMWGKWFMTDFSADVQCLLRLLAKLDFTDYIQEHYDATRKGSTSGLCTYGLIHDKNFLPGKWAVDWCGIVSCCRFFL